MKFNVFYQRLQTFFILVTFFTFFNVFLILISTFFYIYGLIGKHHNIIT